MDIERGGVKFIPLGLDRTRVRMVMKVDPKLAVLPPWLINWVATKVCWLGLRIWEWKAKKLAGSEAEGKEHKQKMLEDAEFYDWVLGRVRDSLKLREATGTQMSFDQASAGATRPQNLEDIMREHSDVSVPSTMSSRWLGLSSAVS